MSKKWNLVMFCVKSHVQTGAEHSKSVWFCGPLTFQFLSSRGSRPKLPAPSPPNILTTACKVSLFLHIHWLNQLNLHQGVFFFFLTELQQNWNYILIISAITQKQISSDRHCKVNSFCFTFTELCRSCWMICDMDFLDGDNWGRT